MSAQLFESPQDQKELPETATNVSALLEIIASRLPPSTPPSATQSVAAGTAFETRKNIALQNRDAQQAYIPILAKHGIKVRDFAYESTLPPVRPVRVLQIQPEPRKRIRTWDGWEDDIFSQNSKSQQDGEGGSLKKQRLGREVTEPDIQPSAPPPTRARGFANFADHNYSLGSQLIQSQQTELTLPPLHFEDESQNSEPYIDTPIVTPNGSLQWRITNNSCIPASQLDTELQANPPEPLSYSQLGISQPDFSSQETSQLERLPPLNLNRNSSSVLSSPPSSPMPPTSSSQDSLPGPSSSSHTSHHPSPLRHSQNTQRTRSSKSPLKHSTDVLSPIHSPRYHLRKRPPLVPAPLAKRSIRDHRALRATHLVSRPPSFSRQSSHSQAKTKTTNGSPSARVLRTRTIVK